MFSSEMAGIPSFLGGCSWLRKARGSSRSLHTVFFKVCLPFSALRGGAFPASKSLGLAALVAWDVGWEKGEGMIGSGLWGEGGGFFLRCVQC